MKKDLQSIQKRQTIFRQLIYNVIVPAVLALLVLGVLNYTHTDRLLKESHEEKNRIITNEIKNFLELRDFSLELVEEGLNNRMIKISNYLVNNQFSETENIESADLERIRVELGMDESREDIYVINREGVIINTTFKDDLGLNLYELGGGLEEFLQTIFKNGDYVSERFTIEHKTRKLKKYSYQPTKDGKYIIELGVYSKKADEIIDIMENRLDSLAKEQQSIQSVTMFIGRDNIFSFSKDATISKGHQEIVKNLFESKGKKSVALEKDNHELTYDYIYMEREKTNLYKGSVIRIISDLSGDKQDVRKELFLFIIVFVLTLVVVISLIYRQTKVITDPIKKLVGSVIRITDGRFNERAEVFGNNEITTLSQKFNMMIEQLESYYNELEQKVKERTAEIEQQKEEITAQRDSIEQQRSILAQTNKSLQSAYQEIEQQQKHITDSIHYASRIQNAILPPADYVKNTIKDSFILYNPKDIVSGDFYWVMQKEERSYFAAVDCTGHGVPGAFMSIVGHNQLNYAVNVKGARKPANILDDLNRGVTETLRQKPGSATVKDGMDIALCCIDHKRNKLEFAGAYNPVVYIRDGEINLIKGDRAPIGAFIDEELHTFQHHEIDIKPGDVYYVFSDGYADQFGGLKGGKFLTKRFRKLLLSIHQKSMDEQLEILLQTYLDWKGKHYQVDDILVIGVKV